MKALLSQVAAVLTLLTFSLLALSVSHEYGYFYLVGRHFQAFATTSDYVANAVLWLPATFLAAGAFVNFRHIRNPEFPTWRNKGSLGDPILVLFALAMWFFFGPRAYFYGVFITGVYIWALVFNLLVRRHGEPDDDFIKAMLRIAQYGAPIVAFTFTLGIIDANSDLASFSDPYIVTLKGDHQPHLKVMLRNFDKGILVRDPPAKRVEFLKWEDVVTIARAAAPIEDEPLSCSWFGMNCNNPIATP